MLICKVLAVFLLCSTVVANETVKTLGEKKETLADETVDMNMEIVAVNVTVETQASEHVQTHEKIVGGIPVAIHEVPYMVSIRSRAYHEKRFGSGHLCGGAVISRRLVCSAAHCFAKNLSSPVQYYGAHNYVVVAGGRQLKKLEGLTQVYLVELIIAHQKFQPETLENDIALLFLNNLIPYNYFTIRPLPLAEKPITKGTICSISGWGNNDQGLQTALVPIVSPRLCSLIYLNLPSTQICAGWLQGGIDACKGDSGGPLVCNGKMTGIISWGVDCGRFFFPGVYTNVSHFVDWINLSNKTLDYSKFVEMRGLDTSTANCHYLKFYLDIAFILVIINQFV